ncbi:MAG: uracil-DNA glycosylase [Planctomycetota bacterium]
MIRRLQHEIKAWRDFGLDALVLIAPEHAAPRSPRPGPEEQEAAVPRRAPGPRPDQEDREVERSVAIQPVLFDSQPTSSRDAEIASHELAKVVASCTRCKLHQGRTQTVFGEGPLGADLMFIGEGPGADEDATGRPFVGRAGQLLTKIIEAMGRRREDVYIANVVKCRPPQNRTPEPDEIGSCLPYLQEQIRLVRPRLICTLGAPATKTLLGITTSMSQARGKIYKLGTIRVVPTFHPAYLLRNPAEKRKVWEDVQLINRLLAGNGG